MCTHSYLELSVEHPDQEQKHDDTEDSLGEERSSTGVNTAARAVQQKCAVVKLEQKQYTSI